MKRLQVSVLRLHVCLDLLHCCWFFFFQNIEDKIYPHTDRVNTSHQTWLPQPVVSKIP